MAKLVITTESQDCAYNWWFSSPNWRSTCAIRGYNSCYQSVIWSILWINNHLKRKKTLFARLQRTTGSIMKWLTMHFPEKLNCTVCSVLGQNIRDWSCIYSDWKLKINLNKQLILVWYCTEAFPRCMRPLSVLLLHFTVTFYSPAFVF